MKDLIANLREDIDILAYDKTPTVEELKIANDISKAIDMLGGDKVNYMEGIIKLDVPNFQIGEAVTVYFKDTMVKRGICESNEVIPKRNSVDQPICKCGIVLGEMDKYCSECGRKINWDEDNVG